MFAIPSLQQVDKELTLFVSFPASVVEKFFFELKSLLLGESSEVWWW
jgi:hypothetical protein